jgi:hypothetical protein
LKEENMKTKYTFVLIVLLISLMASGCASATPTNPSDRFKGTWSGAMNFSGDSTHTEDIVVSIPTRCSVGNVCGELNNTSVGCKWEMTLEAVNTNILTYKFSNTLSGDCPARGGGTLTMQSDGTLFREHKTPDFTASGQLKRQ